jgi:ornithine cyclodeaminase
VLSGLAAGREHADQVTVFDSVGFALEDYSALRYVYELALERGIGEDVALVPPGANPKDLFGQIAAASSPQASAARDALASVLDTLRAPQPA